MIYLTCVNYYLLHIFIFNNYKNLKKYTFNMELLENTKTLILQWMWLVYIIAKYDWRFVKLLSAFRYRIRSTNQSGNLDSKLVIYSWNKFGHNNNRIRKFESIIVYKFSDVCPEEQKYSNSSARAVSNNRSERVDLIKPRYVNLNADLTISNSLVAACPPDKVFLLSTVCSSLISI